MVLADVVKEGERETTRCAAEATRRSCDGSSGENTTAC